jgi:indole-3-glycerol phosphate synthase
MSNTLVEICANKREEIDRRQAEMPLEELKARIDKHAPGIRPFRRQLINNAPALIAEIKKGSPSRGIIRHDFDPTGLAQIYETAGASCLSVLTDTAYFHGADTHLVQARAATSCPVLRKDFMIDAYQVYESRLLGADCILLIMAALDNARAAELLELGQELGMDGLVEVHTADELQRAVQLPGCDLIGVNNRDLATLNVDIATAYQLIGDIPRSVTTVAESGIKDHKTLMNLYDHGYSAFLVGEHLMRADDITGATHALLYGDDELTRNENQSRT